MHKFKFRKKRFGRQLKLERTFQGLTLRECADQIGIHYGILHRIEEGNSFTADTFANAWKWLNSQNGNPKFNIDYYIKKKNDKKTIS